MFWALIPLALLPAALHWWWTRPLADATASAVLPERHLAVTQRLSFVTMLCIVTIIVGAGWHAVWILPAQFVALAASTYRTRRVMFGETWPFWRYLSWRSRFHVGMFGLWWFIAFGPTVIALADPAWTWWLTALALAIALAWHHFSGRVLLWLLRASPLERPDLNAHFARVFEGARVSKPTLWRAGAEGGRLANAFAMITLNRRGVLFLDSLLDQLPPEQITAILAHEVAHLEQFHRRRLLAIYITMTSLIVLLMTGSGVAAVIIPGFESWSWIVSVAAVFAAMWLRARRMQAHETDADLRAIELCGDPDALIAGLIRIHEINHIPRRWSSMTEERATHPSLARRIRTIRDRVTTTHATPEPIELLVVASSERGRYVVLENDRVTFAWIENSSHEATPQLTDLPTVLQRASRVEMISFDQLSELRLSATRGRIELIAIGRQSRRWSMPIVVADAARVQRALDRVDHLIVAPAVTREYGVARRAAILLVFILAAPYNAIGAVLAPALLAFRRPKRALMLALAAALAGTAVASINDPNASITRITLMAVLTLLVLLSVSLRRQSLPEAPDTPLWAWIERLGLLVPVLVGLIFAAANTSDLFGLHEAVRDRAWFTAALAAMASFYIAQTGPRTARRAGLGVAVLATVAFVVGSPWFLLHAVADPLVADMPPFAEKLVPVTSLATRSFDGVYSSVRVTPDATHFVLVSDDEETAEYEDNPEGVPLPITFIAGAFDGWQREIRASDVAVIDDQRLLVLDRQRGASTLRAEDLRSGHVLWTLALPDVDITSVSTATDGRWRAFARRGRQFERLEGRVDSSSFTTTRWTVMADKQSYIDMPFNDGGTSALALASVWQEPSRTSLLTDWRETKRLFHVDGTNTTEIVTSHLSVECTTPPIGVTGSVCVSYDGWTSRLWRADLSSGTLRPLGELRYRVWTPSQPSQHRVAGVANGRPIVAAIETHTVVRLAPDKRCWTMAVDVSGDIVVAACIDGDTTTVAQYRIPNGQ
jgi:heat shock protein HtpX